MAKTRVTEREAQAVLREVRKQFAPYFEAVTLDSGAVLAATEGPTLMMEFDWTGTGPCPAIVWEGGPYEWVYQFTEAQFEKRMIGKRVFIEPITGWALGMYPDSWT